MSSTYHTTEGIVIKKTPYGEADFLVRVLTKDFGKIDLRARGARKYNSKLNSHFDFLDQVNLSFVKSGDHVPTIIDADKISPNIYPPNIEDNLPEAIKVAHSLDLLIPLEVKDSKIFAMSQHFFTNGDERGGEYLIKSVILHEGYGNVESLPASAQDFIMNIWPILKN